MELPGEVLRNVHQCQPELLETVRQSIRIPSVTGEARPGAPYGEEVNRALCHALETAEALGFSTRNLDGQVGWCEYGRGREMVAVLGHLDVVPAGDGWKRPPFAAEVAEGCLWGRGSMDDKGPLFAALYGLKALADAKAPMKRRVRVLFGTNEENGSTEMPFYTSTQELPVMGFTPDGEFPVIHAEKGILNLRLSVSCGREPAGVDVTCIRGGTAANVVPAVCEAKLRSREPGRLREALRPFCGSGCELTETEDGVILRTFGKSAHGSVPETGVNAIARTIWLLEKLPLDSGLKRLAAFLNSQVGAETDGHSLGIAMEDSMGALTLNLGTLRADGSQAEAVLNIRYPVTKTAQEVLKPIEARAREAGLKLELLMCAEPLYYPREHPLVSRLLSVYHACRGPGEPLAIGGGTYAKELPNTVAFGPLFPGREDRNHQSDESISLKELEELTRIYAHAIFELANA